MKAETPTAFGAAIGTGTVSMARGFDAPWVAVDFSALSLSERVVSRGECAPRSKEAFHRHGNPTGRIVGIAELTIIPGQLKPSWQLLVVQLTALCHFDDLDISRQILITA